jgi:hypothetical protein
MQERRGGTRTQQGEQDDEDKEDDQEYFWNKPYMLQLDS